MLFAFFHCVNIYTDGANAMVGETSGSLAQIKAVVPNDVGSHCVLKHHLPRKMPVSLKNIINKAGKISFIKSQVHCTLSTFF